MPDDVRAKIKAIFVEVLSLGADKFDWSAGQDQFDDWDSFSHMELVSKTEEIFGITLEMSEVVELETPDKFVAIVMAKEKK